MEKRLTDKTVAQELESPTIPARFIPLRTLNRYASSPSNPSLSTTSVDAIQPPLRRDWSDDPGSKVHCGQADAVHAARQETLNRSFRIIPKRFAHKRHEPPAKPIEVWINPPQKPGIIQV